jgi:hypothetical protein
MNVKQLCSANLSKEESIYQVKLLKNNLVKQLQYSNTLPEDSKDYIDEKLQYEILSTLTKEELMTVISAISKHEDLDIFNKALEILTKEQINTVIQNFPFTRKRLCKIYENMNEQGYEVDWRIPPPPSLKGTTVKRVQRGGPRTKDEYTDTMIRRYDNYLEKLAKYNDKYNTNVSPEEFLLIIPPRFQ